MVYGFLLFVVNYTINLQLKLIILSLNLYFDFNITSVNIIDNFFLFSFFIFFYKLLSMKRSVKILGSLFLYLTIWFITLFNNKFAISENQIWIWVLIIHFHLLNFNLKFILISPHSYYYLDLDYILFLLLLSN